MKKLEVLFLFKHMITYEEPRVRLMNTSVLLGFALRCFYVYGSSGFLLFVVKSKKKTRSLKTVDELNEQVMSVTPLEAN